MGIIYFFAHESMLVDRCRYVLSKNGDFINQKGKRSQYNRDMTYRRTIGRRTANEETARGIQPSAQSRLLTKSFCHFSRLIAIMLQSYKKIKRNASPLSKIM